VQSSPEVMMGNGNQIIHASSAISQPQPFRIFNYPASDRGVSLVLFNGLAGIGENAAENLIREFVLKRITSHVPQEANGQP